MLLQFLSQSRQERCLNRDRQIRAKFLAAEAADAALILIRRCFRFIPAVPVDRFGLDRAHTHAGAAQPAFGRVDHRARGDQVAHEGNVS